ncbi:hypothetical protein L1987_53131 [Smallanthus sonchifolius]|uniref:Uncharacterized protein n=1 Tax=Smallanthus sonchifolius TaxID=185202 RepID=A0ACB9EV62_9ASTR|nr:hypothetical protein L1987_53131 [Smallanthus sonchifolius]
MGLETYPFSKSLNSSDDCGSIIKMPNSTRSALREPISPSWKNLDVKPISRVPNEAAPWKQRDGARAMTSSTKIRGPVSNVYSEVDKRLKNLEFAESGKDLRALKQILEAMQAVEARSSDHSDHQNTPSQSKESGFANNRTGKSRIAESTHGERRSQTSNPLTDSNDTPNAANNIFKDRYEATNDAQSNTIVSSQITRERLKKVAGLVEKLNNLNSNHNQSPTDYIASLCENTNPNNTYISQILLASGLLLRDLKSFKSHPSGHPINPDLFSVLEHTKFSNLQKGKCHRKLIFDAVNEILVGKLSSDSRMMMMQDPRKILRELCLEIEQFQVHNKRDGCGPGDEEDDLKDILLEDLFKRSENWSGFYGESPVIGMEVEQLIFRDLVNEVVYEL